ncbi:type II secretion system protein N [Acidovorax sp. YS12]|nr:type II secretion system protein N [Acidovorax sp. YS12]
MKRRLLHAALLVLVAGVCALAVMPARWLVAALPASGLLVAVDAGGSIWSGNAMLAVGRPELRRALPEPLRWELRWSGGPHFAVTHPALGGEVRIAPSWRGLRASAQTLRLPASVLPTLHATLGALNPGGELVLSWPDTTLGLALEQGGSPVLDVRWNNATSSLARVRPLGAYRIELTRGEAGRIDVSLSTQSGPLMLQGQGTYAPEGGLRFDGTARAEATAPPDTRAALGDLLNAIGPRQGDIHSLKFR